MEVQNLVHLVQLPKGEDTNGCATQAIGLTWTNFGPHRSPPETTTASQFQVLWTNGLKFDDSNSDSLRGAAMGHHSETPLPPKAVVQAAMQRLFERWIGKQVEYEGRMYTLLDYLPVSGYCQITGHGETKCVPRNQVKPILFCTNNPEKHAPKILYKAP